MDKPRLSLIRPIHLFGLAAWALSYAFFEVLARHTPFFVAHDVGWPELILVGLGLGWLLPALVAGIAAFSGKLTRRGGIYVSNALLVVMAVGIVLRLAVGTAAPLSAVLAAGVIAGILLSILYTRFSNLRFAMSVLALLGLVYAPVFIWWMSRLVLPGEVESVRLSQVPQTLPSVIYLVFDEMSTLAMINPDHSLDAEHFPNFARLAADGIWFRNGTAASDYTTDAVIALATGMNPTLAPGQATYSAYPANVCTVLHAAGYRVVARESMTRFCPEIINEHAPVRQAPVERLRQLFSDILYIVPHVYLSPIHADALAPIEDRWRNFGTDVSHESHHRVESFHEFLATIEPTSGVLYFNHFMFPHIPYEYDAAGIRYQSQLSTTHRLKGDPAHFFHSYMQQAMYVDRLIGQLLDRLEQAGIYEESAIVLAADHGVRYREGASRRDLVRGRMSPADNDILKVPMFIKPHQAQAGGTVDSLVHATDLLPSLLDILGIELEQSLDGQSAVGDASVPRRMLPFLDNSGEVMEHQNSILDPAYDVNWRIARFDAERGFAPKSPFDSALLGKPIAEIARESAAGGHVTRVASSQSSALFEGLYYPHGNSDTTWLAVARDGIIAAIVKPVVNSGDGRAFAALGPAGEPDFFSADIEVFEIVPTTPPKLRTLTIEPAGIPNGA